MLGLKVVLTSAVAGASTAEGLMMNLCSSGLSRRLDLVVIQVCLDSRLEAEREEK
jgi:hypothetical protein